ncbi:DNA methyltransferase, partial [Propionibacterium sp.]|uniref:DNA methyltransferase n=1 Tax=Propionibacterium sp. TaxID=1977903 RepID=UPI0039ECD0EE
GGRCAGACHPRPLWGPLPHPTYTPHPGGAGGEHYTTETNIMKVIGPLFLDEYHQRLSSAWNSKSELTKLWNDLGRIRIMDPACGCGNFLVVSYRELRALELEIMKRRRDLDLDDGKISDPSLIQTSIDVTDTIKVRLDHFYGIEIEEWPSRIAEVAMLLVDHLANQTMTEEFGFAPTGSPSESLPRSSTTTPFELTG